PGRAGFCTARLNLPDCSIPSYLPVPPVTRHIPSSSPFFENTPKNLSPASSVDSHMPCSSYFPETSVHDPAHCTTTALNNVPAGPSAKQVAKYEPPMLSFTPANSCKGPEQPA